MPGTLLKHRDRLDLVKIIQRLQLHAPSQENVPLDPIRQKGVELIAGMFPGGDGKDVVEFFERSLFRFCKDTLGQVFVFLLKRRVYLVGGRRS